MKTIRSLVYFFSIVPLLWLGCNSNVEPYGHLFGHENAVWAESIYLRGYQPTTGEELTDEHLKKYAEVLESNGIKYVYLFAGPYGEDGNLPDFAFSDNAIRSVNLLKEYYPEIIILPWVGGVQNKTVYLEDSAWVENAISDTKKLIENLNVPGIHVDFEYIISGNSFLDKTLKVGAQDLNEDYGNMVNNFHIKLRSAVPSAFISSVVVATSPDTKPWKRKTSLDELRILTQYVDQLSFLYYDTSIDDQILFEENCSYLLKDIQTLKEANDIQYLIAIGTFINEPELHKYRNLEIESIPNSLQTIKRETIMLDSMKQIVDGIALYADWTTDNKEWQQFREGWRKITF